MKAKNLLYTLLIVPALLCSCSSDEKDDNGEDETKTPVLTVSNAKISVPASAGTGSISYSVQNPVSGVKATASTSASWITGFDNSASGKITFKVAENEGDERVGVVSVKYSGATSQSVEVTQMAADASIAVTPDSLGFEIAGGTKSVTVTSGRPWTMEGSADWVTASASEGYPGTEVSFTADTNFTDKERSAEFTFKCASNTAVLKVTQKAASYNISVDKESISFPVEGGEETVTVTADSEWEISGSADWISYTVTDDKILFKASKNTLAESRSVTYTLTSGKGEYVKTAKIEAVQSGSSSLIDAIKDEHLKAYILENYDKDGDNDLSQAEADALTTLEWTESSLATSIDTFEGIEIFRNLKEFSFSTPSYGTILSAVTTIDLTKNTQLEKVTVSCKNVTEVKVDGLSNLQTLSLGLCSQITSQSLTGLSSLKELYLFGTGITSIDISGCPVLEHLSVESTKITSLDVSGCQTLKYLNAGTSTLTSLTLPDNSNITELTLDGAMVPVDFTKLTKLQVFHFSKWNIKTVSFASCPDLVEVNIGGSTVRELDISKNTLLNSLDISNYIDPVYLEKVTMYRGQYIRHIEPDFTTGDYKNKNGDIVEVVYVDPDIPDDIASVITDSNLKAKMLTVADTDSDGKITGTEAAAVKELDVSDLGISSLTGLKYFSELTSLNASKNSLSEIDASAWQKMTDLDVSENSLTSLDLSRMPLLENINASHNSIAEISSFPDSLVRLDYSYNKLTKISQLYFKDNLEYVDLSNNSIKTIDVRENPKLSYLDVSNNQIQDDGTDWQLRIWSLTALKTLKASNYGMTHTIYDVTVGSDNTLPNNDICRLALETVDLSNNTDSRFKILVLTGSASTLQSLDVTGCTSLTDVYLGEGAVISDSAIKKDSGVTVHRTAYPAE
jgi:hypothetical protein